MRPRIEIQPGQRFGNIEIIGDAPSRYNHSYKLCLCNRCGRIVEVRASYLTRPDRPTRSCKCLRDDLYAAYSDRYIRALPFPIRQRIWELAQLPAMTIRRIAIEVSTATRRIAKYIVARVVSLMHAEYRKLVNHPMFGGEEWLPVIRDEFEEFARDIANRRPLFGTPRQRTLSQGELSRAEMDKSKEVGLAGFTLANLRRFIAMPAVAALVKAAEKIIDLVRLTKQRRAERRKVYQRRWAEKHDDERIEHMIAERENDGWSDDQDYDASPPPPPKPKSIPARLRIASAGSIHDQFVAFERALPGCLALSSPALSWARKQNRESVCRLVKEKEHLRVRPACDTARNGLRRSCCPVLKPHGTEHKRAG